jgi:hypothetical protein
MPGHHADYFPTETECWIGRAHCFVDCGKEIAPKTVDARARFVELQATIEAIDRAIEGGPRVRLELANYSFRRGISRTRLKAADREYPTRGPSIG